jgi:hypothetical protein
MNSDSSHQMSRNELDNRQLSPGYLITYAYAQPPVIMSIFNKLSINQNIDIDIDNLCDPPKKIK